MAALERRIGVDHLIFLAEVQWTRYWSCYSLNGISIRFLDGQLRLYGYSVKIREEKRAVR